MYDENAAYLSGLRINYVFKVKTNKRPHNTEKENHSNWKLCPKIVMKRLIKNGTISNIQYKDKIVYEERIIQLTKEFSGFQKAQEFQESKDRIIRLYQQLCRDKEAIMVANEN
jgi:hypothetical protein